MEPSREPDHLRVKITADQEIAGFSIDADCGRSRSRAEQISAGSILFSAPVRRRSARRVWAADRTDWPFSCPRLAQPKFLHLPQPRLGFGEFCRHPADSRDGLDLHQFDGKHRSFRRRRPVRRGDDRRAFFARTTATTMILVGGAHSSRSWRAPDLACLTAWCMSSCASPPSWRRSGSGSWGWASARWRSAARQCAFSITISDQLPSSGSSPFRLRSGSPSRCFF